MDEAKLSKEDLRNLEVEELRKINGKCDPFGTIMDRLLENDYPEELIEGTSSDDALFIENGDVIIVRGDNIDKGDYVEETIIVSYKLDIHPIFLSNFTELLVNTGANYTIGECFLYDPDTYEVIFESDINFVDECTCSTTEPEDTTT